MMPDYPLEETLDFKFTTRAFATGIPTVLAGTPVVEIYEDNSVTQITAAETLTVDFDSVVGLNNLRIVATAANGFESGKSYSAVISTGTVGGVSVVGEVVAQFSIERSAAAADLANVTDGLSALKTLIDAIPTTAMRGTDSAATATNLATVDTVVDAIKAVTDLLPDSGALTAIAADTARLTAVRAAVLTDWINGGRLDLLLDAIPTTAMRGTDSAATATNLATVDTVVDAIKAVTDLLPNAGALTTIGTDTARLTAVRAAVLTDWINGGRLDLLLDAIPTTAMRGTDSAATAANLATVDTVVDAIKVITDALGATAAANLALACGAAGVVTGAAEAGTLSITQMTSDLTEATDDHYIGRVVIWTSGVLLGQASDITDYAGATGLLTYTAVTEAPSAADAFIIV